MERAKHAYLKKKKKQRQFDWQIRGFLESIKNQLKKPICWALVLAEFIGVAASIHQVRDQPLVISAQEPIDCCKEEEKESYMMSFKKAFAWVLSNGIRDEIDYPFTGGDKNVCRHKSMKEKLRALKIRNFKEVDYRNVKEMMDTISSNPITAAIKITKEFQELKKGIYRETKNYLYYKAKDGSQRIQKHAILLVGFYYDAEERIYYWKVKNTWGTEWGDMGFGKVACTSGVPGEFWITQTYTVIF